MQLGKQFNIRMVAHLTALLILNFGQATLSRLKTTKIFHRKLNPERHLFQLFFVFCCFTSIERYIMPLFNHVHMLTRLRAGSRWRKSEREIEWRSRETRKWGALISANFLFPPRKPQERISRLIFTGGMNFSSSNFTGKVCKYFFITTRGRDSCCQ